MIDRHHNAPDGARIVTYQEQDEEWELMCRAFADKGLDPEAWRYVFSAIGPRGSVVHYFCRPGCDLFCTVREKEELDEMGIPAAGRPARRGRPGTA